MQSLPGAWLAQAASAWRSVVAPRLEIVCDHMPMAPRRWRPPTRQPPGTNVRSAHRPPPTPNLTPYTHAERYEDLDELIARYLEPVQQYLHKLVAHRKYRMGQWERLQVGTRAGGPRRGGVGCAARQGC